MRRILTLLAAFGTFWISHPTHARTIGSHAGFTASVADNASCAKAIDVRLDSDKQGGFENDRANFVKLVGLVRVVMGFECQQVERINFSAHADGQKVGTTHIKKSSGWVLTPLKRVARGGGDSAVRGSGKSVTRGGARNATRGGAQKVAQAGANPLIGDQNYESAIENLLGVQLSAMKARHRSKLARSLPTA